jgi:hypothetical protein
VDFHRAVVRYEPQFSVFVHEEAHAGPRGNDHLGFDPQMAILPPKNEKSLFEALPGQDSPSRRRQPTPGPEATWGQGYGRHER